MPVPYTKEQIEQANRVNLIEYARNIGYDLEKRGNKSLHVKNSGGLYLFEDSNKYYHFTSDKKGGVIDFVMQFEGKTFLDAVEHLLQRKIYNVSYAEPNQKKYEKKEMVYFLCPKKQRIISGYIGISVRYAA